MSENECYCLQRQCGQESQQGNPKTPSSRNCRRGHNEGKQTATIRMVRAVSAKGWCHGSQEESIKNSAIKRKANIVI